MTAYESILEFARFPGNLWMVMVFVLVCADLVLKRLSLTLIAIAAFTAAFFGRLFVPWYGQVIIFAVTCGFLLWKGRRPIQRWREKTSRRIAEAVEFAGTVQATVIEPIRSSTLPGRVLIEGVIMPARSKKPVREGTVVSVTSAGPEEVWVGKKE